MSPVSALRGLILLAAGLLAVVALQGGTGRAAPARPAAPPIWGPNARVNPLTSVTPSVQRNAALAVDPANPDRIVAGYDSWDPGATYSGYGISTDGGRTWAGGRFYGPWISDAIPFGEPNVAVDQHGIIYYSCLATGNQQGNSAYMVLTSTDGLAWNPPVPAVTTRYDEYYDQGRLAVDLHISGPYAGRIYLLARYSNIARPDQGLRLRYSTDQGRTWSADADVADPPFPFSEGPALSVASDGTLYAAYETNPYDAPDLYLHRSTDGGATWTAGSLIGGAPIAKVGAIDPEGIELLLLGASDRGFRVSNTPAIAVDRAEPGTVYAVWNDGRWDSTFDYYGNTGRHGDIAFSRSTDGGATWSAPARVNDDPIADGVDQFAPTIATGPDGRIGVTWYDRRADPDHRLYALEFSESTDGGRTWSTNTAVSDQLSDPLARTFFEGNGDLSGYNALVYGPDFLLPTWVNSRAGAAQDIYTDRGEIAPPPSATPSPAPVPPSATPIPPSATPAPPSATPAATATPCDLSFGDVQPADYFYEPVRYLACHGVVGGYADGTFRPYNATTRGQLSKLIVLGFGWPVQTPATPTFVDVPPGQPFYGDVETIAAHGVVSGYDCGGPGEPCPGRYFRPGANVTRGQLAKIVVGAAGWPPLTPPTPTFADVPAGAPFFGFVERAAAQGILSGYGCGAPGEPCPGRYFRPGAGSTRGQLAKILFGVLQMRIR